MNEELNVVAIEEDEAKEDTLTLNYLIPTSFRKTDKPSYLVLEDLEDFESKDRYTAYLKAGNTVKLFKLSEPVTDDPVSDRYAVQYEAIVYKGETMQRLYRERLDANFKVIDSENFG